MEDTKKKYYCPFIANGIHFAHDKIRFCSANKQGPLIAENYKGEKINWDELYYKRLELLKQFEEGILPPSCNGCFNLSNPNIQNKVGTPTKKVINQLYVSNWLHCNTACTYCVNKHLTNSHHDKKIKKSEFYDLYPIVKEMIDNKILEKESIITFSGGEPTVLKEFDDLLKIIANHVEHPINVLSSGIRYNKEIEKQLKNGKVLLVVSIDSGTRETYKQIKRVDEFKNVVNNLKKYAKASKTANQYITSKYILIDKVNDNLEEIEKWLVLSRKINLKNVRLDVEYSNSALNAKAIPKHYYDIFSFVKTKTKELDLNLESIDQVNQILEKGYVF